MTTRRGSTTAGAWAAACLAALRAARLDLPDVGAATAVRGAAATSLGGRNSAHTARSTRKKKRYNRASRANFKMVRSCSDTVPRD